MRTSRLALAALLVVAGMGTIGSSLAAASVSNAADADSTCGASSVATTALNLDLIPSKPVVGHQSVRGAGDEDGCGEGSEHGAGGSERGEGADDNDD